MILADLSRQIDGCIAKPSVPFKSEHVLKAIVMGAYDRYDYAHTAESWAYLILPEEA
jgi:hypothetical protein